MSALKVLIPLDGSSFSRQVLSSVQRFLTPKRHQLILMRVVSSPAGLGPLPPRMLTLDGKGDFIPNYSSSADLELAKHPIFDTQTWENLKAEVTRELGPDLEALKAADFDVVILVHTGTAAEEIVHAVRQRGVDLVIMATHGRKGLERLFMGSVAEDVLQHIEVPVLMLRPDTEQGSVPVSVQESHILLPLDQTEFSQAVLKHLVYLLGPRNHQVTLLHVAPVPEIEVSKPMEVVPGAWSVSTGYPSMSQEEKLRFEQERASQYLRMTEDIKAQILQEMESTGEFLKQSGFRVHLEVRFGNPAEEIKLFAQYNHIDLVAMATHSRVGLERLILGSVARDVLRGTHVPVLMIKPDLNTLESVPTMSAFRNKAARSG